MSIVAVTLSACTGDRTPAPSASGAAASSLPGTAPEPAARCHQSGSVPAVKTALTTADGVHLAGVQFSSGARGVLLLPQRGADLCPWWSYATELVGQGFQVLAIDLRGTGFSENSSTLDYTADAAAGVAELRRSGATKVVIVGASLGAAVGLVTAARVPEQVAGVISLSYPDNDLDVTGGAGAAPRTPAQAAPKITAPVLLAYTVGDRQAADPQPLAAQLHGPVAQLVGRPGVSHGWDLLKVGTDDVRPDLLAFLQSYD
jgi:pimeloyl-ACP methyl ester carboxylesterase